MKILLGSGTPEQLGRGIYGAFKESGWEVFHIDTSPESPYYKTFIKPIRKVINALRIQRSPSTFETWSISNINWRSNRWLQAIKEIQPDVVLHVWGHRISEPVMIEACKIAPHICWMIEAKDRLSTPMDYCVKGYYKHLIVYAQNYLKIIEKRGVSAHYMPHFSPFSTLNLTNGDRTRKYDWVFLGSHSPWREKCLLEVMSVFPNGFILGPRWKHALRKSKTCKGKIIDGYLGGAESLRYYQDSFVGLDIPSKRDWTENGVTMRIPELIASGVHVLTQENPEIRILPYFHEKCFTIFKDFDDLISSMGTALKTSREMNNEERMLFAKSATGYQSLIGLVAQIANKGEISFQNN